MVCKWRSGVKRVLSNSRWSARPSVICNYVRALIFSHVLTCPPHFLSIHHYSPCKFIMSLDPSHLDVLIVGAGPAGLMCANALVRAGVNVRVIDRRCVSFYYSTV